MIDPKPLDYCLIKGVRHWPQSDGNYWGGLGVFTERENLLADWIDRMKAERDDAMMKLAHHSCVDVLS